MKLDNELHLTGNCLTLVQAWFSSRSSSGLVVLSQYPTPARKDSIHAATALGGTHLTVLAIIWRYIH